MAKAELSVDQLPQVLIKVQRKYMTEIAGAVVFGLGVLAFASLRSSENVVWLQQAAGWTAPLFALSFVVAGVALVFRERAGYWSPEALLGAELLLFSLASATWVVQNKPYVMGAEVDGTGGGILGYMMGGALSELLGHGVALIVLALTAVVGAYLVIRYSPLIYIPAYTARLLPVLLVYVRWLAEKVVSYEEVDDVGYQSLPRTRNFVEPYSDTAESSEAGVADWDQFFGAPPSYSNVEQGAQAQLSAAVPMSAADSSGQTAASSSTQKSDGSAKKRKTTAAKTSSDKKSSPASRAASTIVYPPIELLKADAGVYGGADARILEQTIEKTLGDFDVPVRVVHVESGPTVTQFGVEPLFQEKSGRRRKVRVNRIASLADDLALALAAKSVRIEAPVPGRPYVGIEVPNSDKSMVALRGIMESKVMNAKGELLLGLGRDTSGEPVVMDLTKAPHMLIAGATGSGKSVCINSILTSLLMKHGPDTLQLVLVDPKMVELPGYNGIPHLIGKVITDVEQVMGALTWLLIQMDDRYQLFREHGVKNITAYNEKARKHKRGKDAMETLPYIVLVVDELADLMMTAAEDVERQVTRLAQMARATGIHLILATQRPSTDVVTGVIKANFPTRISFAVTSQVDSRVILDQQGAERLLGQGDMLFLRPDAAKLYRLQGCYVSDEEIDDIVSFWKQNGDDSKVIVPPWNGLMDRMDDEDELILDAMDLLRGMKSCSTSMLQRKLRLGYPKAARLMGQLEDRGAVGPDMGGGKGRKVLIKSEDEEDELEELESV